MPPAEFRRIHKGDRRSASAVNKHRDHTSSLTGLQASGGLTFHHDREITWLRQRQGEVIRMFELSEAVQFPDTTRTTGSASEPDIMWVDNCYPVLYSPNDYVYADNTSLGPQTLYFPLAYLTANGIAAGYPLVDSGKKVYAKWNKQSGRWEVMALPFDLLRFELIDALTPGGNATANVRFYESAAYTLTPTWAGTEIEIEVYDIDGEFRGRAKDAYGSPHNAGSRGLAKYMPQSSQWEIVKLTKNALKIQGAATADPPTAIDGVTVMSPSGAIIVDQDHAGNINVTDFFGWGCSDGDLVIAVWNENTVHWEIQEIVCP